MKTINMFLVAMALVMAINPALQAKNIGPCMGEVPTMLWTGAKGTKPTVGLQCPAGTVPGVLGTADSIKGGRVAQDVLDGQRAEIVAPAGWDGSWCTLSRTAVVEGSTKMAAAVACVPLENFVGGAGDGNNGGGSAVPPVTKDLTTEEADFHATNVSVAAWTSLGVPHPIANGGGGTQFKLDKPLVEGGVPVRLRAYTKGAYVSFDANLGPDVYEFGRTHQSGWYSAVKWVIPPIIGGLAGYAGGAIASPERLQGGVFETGAQWKCGLIGLASGLVVSTIWELID